MMQRREFFKAVAAGATVAWTGRDSTTNLARGETLPAHWGQPHVPAGCGGRGYPLGPQSQRHPGVPEGQVFNIALKQSAIYPGMECTIQVYVPAQYQARKPACVCLFLDGLWGAAPVVFDNLIHQKHMPVCIGIGLLAGQTHAARSRKDPRWNRSFEFDSMTDVLADFIIHEVLPAVEGHKTPGGLPIRLSPDPNDRCIAGGSSGGIGAFNAAWRRPDAFRRVYIVSGTFVGMRGGDRFPVLIRKTEPKPLRVFINDGIFDEWWGGPEFGDWWISNLNVERALHFAGYHVQHLWGKGGHCGQGGAVLPQALRWLWQDWPRPVTARLPGNFNIQAIIKVGQEWRPVLGSESQAAGKAYQFPGYASAPVIDAASTAAALASDRQGRVFVMNPAAGRIERLTGTGQVQPFVAVSPGDNGMAFGPDGRLYVVETARARVVAFDPSGTSQTIADGLAGRGLTVTPRGEIYVTQAAESGSSSGQVWLVRPNGRKQVVAEGLNAPSGLALTPDGLWLCVGESQGHHAFSYQVKPDGDLRCGEPFYWLHVPDAANDSGVGQICMDRQGRAYAATRLGIQVLDHNGRVVAILPVVPWAQSQQLAGICFGGRDFKTLYVSTGSGIYRRQMNVAGMPPWAAPIAVPQWGAG